MSALDNQSSAPEPEIFRFQPTSDVPNNTMPVLVFRAAFTPSTPLGEIRSLLHSNHWIAGSNVEPNKTPTFHTKTHELHAVARGRCQLLVGGSQYGPPPGQMIYLSAGDIIAYPAGVSSCVVNSQDYDFMAFYPEKSNKRDDCECRANPKEMKQHNKNINKVAMPRFDPLSGKDGPLVEIWKLAIIQDNIASSWF